MSRPAATAYLAYRLPPLLSLPRLSPPLLSLSSPPLSLRLHLTTHSDNLELDNSARTAPRATASRLPQFSTSPPPPFDLLLT